MYYVIALPVVCVNEASIGKEASETSRTITCPVSSRISPTFCPLEKGIQINPTRSTARSTIIPCARTLLARPVTYNDCICGSVTKVQLGRIWCKMGDFCRACIKEAGGNRAPYAEVRNQGFHRGEWQGDSFPTRAGQEPIIGALFERTLLCVA